MRFLTAAPLLSLFAAFVVAEEAPSDVISLTAADFESVVTAEPLILVEFFAPWSNSSSLHSVYVALTIFLIGVDTARLWLHTMRKLQPHLRKRTLSLPRLTVSPRQTFVKRRVFRVTRKISAYSLALDTNHKTHSTLKVYRKGQATEYSGPRKSDGIISYMVK